MGREAIASTIRLLLSAKCQPSGESNLHKDYKDFINFYSIAFLRY